MASEKLRRDNAAGGEEKVHVERDRVPKMATHFESLTTPGGVTVEREFGPGGVRVEREFGPGGVREKMEGESDKRKEEAELLKGIGKLEGDFGEKGQGEEMKGFSNEEVSGYRQQAQQGSIDALGAAEERYNQAKATASSTLQKVKDTVFEKGTQAKDCVLGKEAAGGTHTTDEGRGTHAKDPLLEQGTEGAHKATESMGQKGGDIKDTPLEKGTTMAEGAQRAMKYMAEKGGVVKDTALEKGAEARNTLAQGAQTTVQYLAEKGQVAKEGTASVAGRAKEALVSVAVGAADRAAVAGWAAAEFATGMTVEGTKKAADMSKGMAGYAGEKVGVVKDKVVETEESVRDYAAGKKEEAKRDFQAKNMGQQQERGIGKQGMRGVERSMVEEVVQKPKEAIGEFIQGGEEEQQDKGNEGDESGGLLQAISETIAEIAYTTKNLVIDQDETENQGEKTTTMMGQHTQKSDQQKQ